MKKSHFKLASKTILNATVLPILSILAILATSFTASAAQSAAPSLEEVWRVVQLQQQQIEQLQKELQTSQMQLAETHDKLASQNAEQESRIQQSEAAIEVTALNLESAYATKSDTGSSIGGYGEVHYNNLDNGKEVDLHRFVMFFSHEFRDGLSFYSELEVEHGIAGEGQPGEVEVEQAFVQWDYLDNHRVNLGVFLMPLGILNETHEPDTFYGVERNSIERNIIPATWWESGALFNGDIAPGWGYDFAIHSGLKLDTDNASASRRSSIRSARQKAAQANADSLAYTARLRFSGIPGVQWNTSLQYQTDLTQGDADGIGIAEIDATLLETSFDIEKGHVGFRALYARWDLNDDIEILNPGADEQTGWYIEPSYKFGSNLGVYARYGRYDLTAGSSATSDEKNQFDFGVNYWLNPNVVIKADYQRQDNDNGTDIDGFNLGVGYSF